jgi:hypothetical protein
MDSTKLLWVIFWATFVLVSGIDYFVVTHRKTTIGVRSALRWTALWVAIALSFSVAIYLLHPNGKTVFMEYISGYLTEYSLSVDNLFVFILIFSLMGVNEVAQPKAHQARHLPLDRPAHHFHRLRHRARHEVLVAALRLRRAPRLDRLEDDRHRGGRPGPAREEPALPRRREALPAP